MDQEVDLERVEVRILRSVKFTDFLLQEMKRENQELEKSLGMSYSKYIGLVSPFEEAVCALRKVKGELDSYLKIVRSDLVQKYKNHRLSENKNGKRDQVV